MNRVPLVPKLLDGPLRVLVLVRLSDVGLGADAASEEIAAHRSYLERHIRADYDWPVEFYELSKVQNGRETFEEALWLIESGGWEVLIVEDLSRLGRRTADLIEFVRRCVAVGGRVLSLAEGFDTAEFLDQ